MAHSHKSESKSSRSSKLRSIGMGGGQGRSGRDNAAAFDGPATMSSADQAPAGLAPTTPGSDSATAGLYARGGRAKARKVVNGVVATPRMDRKPRKSGGRICKAEGGPTTDLGSGGSDKKTQAQRKADAPLKPKKPQELDTGSMPLFGDSAKQGSLFKRGGRAKHAKGGKVGTQDYTGTKTPVAKAATGETNLSRRYQKASGGGMRSERTENAKAQADYIQKDQAAKTALAKTFRTSRDSMADVEDKPSNALDWVKNGGPEGYNGDRYDDDTYKRGGKVKREKRATGGSVKSKGKGGSTVNVIIAPQGAGAGAGAPPPPPAPVVPGPAPSAPPPGGAPGGPGAPPMNGGAAIGGAPGMAPPPGPGGFARGGAANPIGQAGQHSGVGRMNQAAFYGRNG